MLKLILAAVLARAAFASPAEAHRRHNHRPHRHARTTVFVTPWGLTWQARAPRVRLNENCVWKPWNNRTVCRY